MVAPTAKAFPAAHIATEKSFRSGASATETSYGVASSGGSNAMGGRSSPEFHPCHGARAAPSQPAGADGHLAVVPRVSLDTPEGAGKVRAPIVRAELCRPVSPVQTRVYPTDADHQPAD